MRKVQWVAMLWTFILAVPFTVLAISATACLTENWTGVSAALAAFSQATTAGGRGWIQEIAERLPEVAGMVVGQLVILTIFLFARQGEAEKGPGHSQ